MKSPKLDILMILQQDVEENFSSRQKSKVLHKTKDIEALGDKVENSVIRVITRKLPLKYYVSQGHIVGEKLKTSSQLDLIISITLDHRYYLHLKTEPNIFLLNRFILSPKLSRHIIQIRNLSNRSLFQLPRLMKS